MERYAYVRISSKDQNPQRQINQMHEEGLDDRHIFIDKQTGRNFDRAAYNLLVGTEKTAPLLRKGDELIVHELKRLGRNYTEIQKQWQLITKEIGANIKVLDVPLLNTANVPDSLDNAFVKDLVLQILCYVAEKELQDISKSQREGIEAAKKAGKHLGRPKAEYPQNWLEVISQYQSGEISAVKAMELTGTKKSTFYKLLKRSSLK